MEIIEGGYKRNLGNGKAIFLLPQLFGNIKIAIGDADDDTGYDDSW